MENKKNQTSWYKKRYHADSEWRKARQLDAQKQREDRYNFCANVKVQFGCSECGEDHYICLEFHHVDPEEKRQNKGKTAQPPSIFHLGWDNIIKELAKCEIMCMNCHHKFHERELPVNEIQKNKNSTHKLKQEILTFPKEYQRELYQ